LNLILFDPNEIDRPLRSDDQRARHLLTVLRRGVGEQFDAGLINGPRGKGCIVAMTDGSLTLSFHWEPETLPVDPVTLLIGLARPQTARDILRDATTLGVAAIHFAATEKSEASYAQSSLWQDGEWERHVRAGAEQAFSTLIPRVSSGQALEDLVRNLPPGGTRLALDNYEAGVALSQSRIPREAPLVLSLGPERGWGPRDRVTLRAAGFTFVHLGSRVLRVETAVIAALTLAKAARGAM
jgi:RsmE family RNA methyltransferase